MSHILPWIRLLSGLKYSFVFFIILIALPFSAFKWMPLYSLLGGLFLELDTWAVFWTSIGFFAASWSLMSVTGLSAGGLTERHPELGSGSYLPEGVGRFLGLPVTRGQMLLFSTTALIQCAVVVYASEARGASALAALAGGVMSYLVMVVLSTPAALIAPDDPPIPRWWLVDRIWALFAWLRPLVKVLYRLVSKVFDVLHLRAALVPEAQPPRLQAGHFYAMTTVSGLSMLLALVGWVFFPPAQRVDSHPPAGAYLYILLLLLIWVLNALDFHFSRIRVSAILVVLLIMAVVYNVQDIDYYYDAIPQSAQAANTGAGSPGLETPLDPVEVARTSRAPENLVVVASSGGGILASGWTTLVLREMLKARPQLADEIRLLSTASGGSVGAAYYVTSLKDLPDSERTSAGLGKALEAAFRGSTTSSLKATAFGLAFLDFERIFIGNTLPVLRDWDRGMLLENSWQRISGDRSTLFDLRPGIRLGRLPALILNTTVMEKGHRLMLTPVDFRGVRAAHAMTQTEFLGGEQEVDIGLWTSARLSATFPYVSPAARSDLDPPSTENPTPEQADVARRRAYHMLDGGYFDNFGITSTFDWLWPVLEARLREAETGGTLSFKRVLIIKLNPFAPSDPPNPQKGLLSALAGPLLGLAAIRNGAQITRNETDLDRGLSSWQSRFDRAGLDVCLKSIEVRPPKGEPDGPLSWHLTHTQIEALEKTWDTVVPQWKKIEGFLEQSGCDG